MCMYINLLLVWCGAVYLSLFSVPIGYYAIFNATHYEFDVSVYSPVGTVVFEALIFLKMCS